MNNPTKEQRDTLEIMFASNHDNYSRRHKLSQAFLRPAYQYTSQEICDPGWEKIRQAYLTCF